MIALVCSDIFNLKKSNGLSPEVIEIGITRPYQDVIHLDEYIPSRHIIYILIFIREVFISLEPIGLSIADQ